MSLVQKFMGGVENLVETVSLVSFFVCCCETIVCSDFGIFQLYNILILSSRGGLGGDWLNTDATGNLIQILKNAYDENTFSSY